MALHASLPRRQMLMSIGTFMRGLWRQIRWLPGLSLTVSLYPVQV
jgi:hypothetical protein